MADESILTYKKPGFPKTNNTERGYRTTIEYVGPKSTLEAAEPAANASWGDYDGRVTSTDLNPLEGTTQAELTVVTEYFYDQSSSSSAGTPREITYEVEWSVFERSLFEHPAFAPDGGGVYELNSTDIADIEAWKNETDPTLKAAYSYNEFALTGSGSTAELSASAIVFAKGLELGLETWEDYAPIIRKTTNYTNGGPGESTAGVKGGDPTFPGKPAGYEWRKSADRGVNVKGQTRWDRVEEWVGAKKVLIDKNTIYWV